MRTEPILAETIAGIHHTLGGDLDPIGVDRVVVGLFFAGVKLENVGRWAERVVLVSKARMVASCAA
jgi:hypothetical protein